MDLKTVKEESAKIRHAYHELEKKIHGSEWSVEEDALAFLTDAGLVGRYTMSKEGRWPSKDEDMLEYKIGECVWWLSVLADRMDLNFEECVEKFIKDRSDKLNK
ncbi:MAG: MazG-like protein [Gemella sp.]|nr:MazG-like protein [Gemella sp.]